MCFSGLSSLKSWSQTPISPSLMMKKKRCFLCLQGKSSTISDGSWVTLQIVLSNLSLNLARRKWLEKPDETLFSTTYMEIGEIVVSQMALNKKLNSYFHDSLCKNSGLLAWHIILLKVRLEKLWKDKLHAIDL